MKHKKKLKKATMKEVADRAGVSIATVSRTLMQPEKVLMGTRRKVEEAAFDMEYFVQSGRGVKRGESHAILVIVPDLRNPFFTDIIRGIEAAASQHHHLVLICDCTSQEIQEKTLIDIMQSRQTDGIVLLGAQIPIDIRSEQQSRFPPIVMTNEFLPQCQLPTLHIDNLTAAFELVNHLRQEGWRRIACIAGPENLSICQYRLQGYRQALLRHGLAVNPDYIVHKAFTLADGAIALKQLMSLPIPPEAIFCHNDILALGAMSQAKNMGLSIPNDLSIGGFDDIELSRYSDPPLTTISQPGFDMGYQAMLLLLRRIKGEVLSTHSYLLDFELKIRKSTRRQFPRKTFPGMQFKKLQ